jgi:hypothetical protein
MAPPVRGVDGLTVSDVNRELDHGGRFVVFQWVVSPLLMSFKRSSPIYFVRANEGTFKKAWPYVGLSLLLGWWGVPWGLFWTPASILRNVRGGIDVTPTVVKALNSHELPPRLHEHAFDGWGEDTALLDLGEAVVTRRLRGRQKSDGGVGSAGNSVKASGP